MVKFSGELDVDSSGCEMAPEPVQIAPLKSPSMDWELPTASRICGCAGRVTVRGTWAIETDGAAAMALDDKPQRRVYPAEASASAMRRCLVFDISLSINKVP